MLTIADRVKSWVATHPIHASFMAQGLLNASALARTIRPEIQKQMGEPISQEAITLALNRYSKQMNATTIDFDQFIGEISVQSGLSIITIPQVGLDPDAFSQAIVMLHKSHEYTLYSRGVWHTALVGKRNVVDDLALHFKHTIIINNLVAITIKLKPGHLPTPGVCAYILQKIAFRGINLHEVSSSHDEFTLIIHQDDTNIALDCLL